MPEAIPYKNSSWHLSPVSTYPINLVKKSSEINGSINGGETLKKLVKENAVIVFARKGCCMIHVVKRLLHRLGANPAVYELDVDDRLIGEIERATASCGGSMQFPAVFIGGSWFGGLDRVIATHITEELAPLLKKAGALWL